MYKVIANDVSFEFKSHSMAKLAEAVERSLGFDYEFHYPDGTVYVCKVKNCKE